MKKILETLQQKWAEYLLEIFVIVIGIVGAFLLNNWNQDRLKRKTEIVFLNSFKSQLQDDIREFDECLRFYADAEVAIDIILSQLENNTPYHDSLSQHFFTSTRFYGDADLDNNVFESLKSTGVDLISNEDIRKRIVRLYEDADEWIINFEMAYRDFLFDARQHILNTRFRDFWNGDYRDQTFRGQMVPLDFEALRTDQEYLYFIRTQKNNIGWFVRKPIEETRAQIVELIQDLDKEIQHLENR